MKPNVNRFLFFSLLAVMLLFATFQFYGQNKTNKKDTVLINSCKTKSRQFFDDKKYDSAFIYVERLINYAQKTNDTVVMAEAYFRKGFYQRRINDINAYQSYSEGVQLALHINDSITAAKMLINVAGIQNSIGDFFGAQNSAVKGLELISKEQQPLIAYNLYNNLANAFRSAEDYDNAIKAHNDAMIYVQSIQQKSQSLNNLANAYRNKELYSEAVKLYKDALKDSAEISSTTKARLLDNLGFAQFLSGNKTGILQMNKALLIRESIDDNSVFASHIHLIQYYLQKNPEKAILHSQNALQTAKKVKSPDWEAEALSYYIQLYPNAIEHIKRYVFLTDSIDTAQKTAQNKYAGIIYQTEKKEKENFRLKQEKTEQELLTQKANTQKWILALVLLLVAITAFLIWKRYKIESKAKQTISNQKDEIEQQKNKVETLQKELHHRMKNNLSFIDLFISLAKAKFPDKAYQDKLNDLQNRMRSMFEVHKQLFKKDDITSVNAKNYIDTLTDNVKKAYTNNNVAIINNINKNEALTANSAFTVGLIVNEFVTNSFKYAFEDNDKGTIAISLSSDPQNYTLNLKDTGKGLPDDFDINSLNSFGMETIQLLTKEHRGAFQIDGSNGVSMNITLPKTAA